MDEQPAAKKGPHLMHEADVGSGETSPGQQDTQALIEQIGEPVTKPPPAPPAALGTSTIGSSAAAAADPDRAVTPPGEPPHPADSASAGPP